MPKKLAAWRQVHLLVENKNKKKRRFLLNKNYLKEKWPN